MTNTLAPIAAASFFVIAGERFQGLLHCVRNDKKDIAESGIKLLKTIIYDFEFLIINSLTKQ
jgi:hypothetical protein